MDVETPSGIGIQSDQYGMESFKRVLSGSLQYISISNSKLFPKFIGQKTKKKSMFGGNKNIHSLCMYPQSSQMKYDSSRFLWMSNIILEENCVYVFTLASHPIPPLLHTLLHPSCLCARERASEQMCHSRYKLNWRSKTAALTRIWSGYKKYLHLESCANSSTCYSSYLHKY